MNAYTAETPAATTRPTERRFPRFWSRRQPSPAPYVELDCACGVRISAAGFVGVLATRRSIFNHTCRTEGAPPRREAVAP